VFDQCRDDCFAFDDNSVRPWLPHDWPERPFDTGTWIDDCPACLLALRAEAAVRPHLLLCLKTCADRILVTVEHLAEALNSGLTVEDLCYVPGDRVREVFVPVSVHPRPPDGWWSLTATEDRSRRAAQDASRE